MPLEIPHISARPVPLYCTEASEAHLSQVQAEQSLVRTSFPQCESIDRISIRYTVVVCNKKFHRDGCSIAFISRAPTPTYRI